jgi:hypothetical protein
MAQFWSWVHLHWLSAAVLVVFVIWGITKVLVSFFQIFHRSAHIIHNHYATPPPEGTPAGEETQDQGEEEEEDTGADENPENSALSASEPRPVERKSRFERLG